MSIHVPLNHHMHSPFFYLLFACYLLLCAYIAWSGMHALPRNRPLRILPARIGSTSEIVDIYVEFEK